MSEQRTNCGSPVPGPLDRLDPIIPPPAGAEAVTQPRDYADPDPDEWETWRDELPDNERLVYDAIQARVARAVHHSVRDEDVVWLVEETLYQITRIWLDLRPHAMELPGVGAIHRGADGGPLRPEPPGARPLVKPHTSHRRTTE